MNRGTTNTKRRPASPQGRGSAGVRSRSGSGTRSPGNKSRGTAGRKPTARRPTGKPYKKKPLKKSTLLLFRWIEAFIEAAVVVFILFFVLWPLKIDGVSMEPSLIAGDRILVSKAMAFLGSVKYGDVVICRLTDADGKETTAVRRVIGVPSDLIRISDGKVSVNGIVIEENYLPSNVQGTYPDTFIVLKSSEYFVLGDNRPVSGDSRTLGPITKSDISAKVVLKFYPLSSFKFY